MDSFWFRCLPKSMEERIEELKKDTVNWYGRREIRVVVAGDPGTGKSTFITAVNSSEPPSAHTLKETVLPGALKETVLRSDFHPRAYPIPVRVVDTQGGLDDEENAEKLKQADVIVLTFEFKHDNLESLISLRKKWIPGLQRLKVDAPIMVVGCKWDLLDNDLSDWILKTELMNVNSSKEGKVVHIFLCCALTMESIHRLYVYLDRMGEVFYRAQSVLLAPSMKLYNLESNINSKLHRALLRIFFLYDHDKDGFIKAEDFNKFKEKCFGLRLCEKFQRMYVPSVIADNITFKLFIVFVSFLFGNDDYDTMWTVLRQYGYNYELELSDDLISSPMRQTDLYETVELSSEAIDFLIWIFNEFDHDHDGALTPDELIKLFRTAPKSPFDEAPYRDAAEKNGLSLVGFLSLWALMALLDPTFCFKNLLYIGYSGEPTDALCATRKRTIDCQWEQPWTNVFQCFVFGPKKSGKSALLDSFLERLQYDTYTPTYGDRYAVNFVRHYTGTKIFVLREFPEDTVDKLLSRKEDLAACDIAVFVCDSSDVSSKNGATNLQEKVGGRFKDAGFEVPFRFVEAEHCPLSFFLQQVSQDTVLPINLWNNLFYEIANVVEKVGEYKRKGYERGICGRSHKYDMPFKVSNGSRINLYAMSHKDDRALHKGLEEMFLEQPWTNVFQYCFVFGPKKSGKSALLDSFLKRLQHDTYTPTYGVCYAVNLVEHHTWFAYKNLSFQT